MQPSEMVFDIGQTIHKQPLRLVFSKSSGGQPQWTLVQDSADQRDQSATISGLSGDVIRKMAEAVNAREMIAAGKF